MPRCSCVKHDCDGRFDWSSFAEGPRCAYNICLLATQLGEFRGEGDPQEGESSCQESQEGVGSGKPSADGRCRKAINGPCHVMHPVQAHTYYIYIYIYEKHSGKAILEKHMPLLRSRWQCIEHTSPLQIWAWANHLELWFHHVANDLIPPSCPVG